MHDPNRVMKWLLVIGMVVLSLTILYPPSEKLKGGIDLVGGTSLLFEIDTSGLTSDQQRGLSTKVMSILRERVDPKGQLNLEWRPIGNTRLEIRMPRPPKEAFERRAKYNAALDRLIAKNLTRFDVESALNASGDERTEALGGLIRGVDERSSLVEVVSSAYDVYGAAREGEDNQAETKALGDYEKAVSDLLRTSLPINRLTDILALKKGKKREAELKKLRSEFPSYDKAKAVGELAEELTTAVNIYDEWAKNKADLEDPSDLKRRIRGAGVLEFRILADRDSTSPSKTAEWGAVPSQDVSQYTDQLKQYGPRPRAGDRYRWFVMESPTQFMHVKDMDEFEDRVALPTVPIVEEYAGRYYVLAHNDAEFGMLRGKKWSLQAAYVDQDPMTGENVVSFALNATGGNLFGELTGSNVNRDLCIMLDNAAMSYANIIERITTRCQIKGGFSQERVQNIVRILDAGSLPARLKPTPLREVTVGPSLGETNRRKGLQAAVWGSVSVAIFVLLYYGIVAGGMANIALAMNLLFVLAAMALMQATFTLPGIAGLILTIGMAIDANVLIFERIREEVDRGVIFKKALNLGYDRAFSTIMDANITTLITCVILGFVGSEEVKGFAVTLGIGITTSMFTALFVTRLVYNTLIAKGWLKGFSMRRIIGKPSIDWLALRSKFWPVSLVLVLSGLGLFIGMSNVNKEAVYGIEFLGGTSVQIDLKPGIVMSDEDVADAITSEQATDGSSALQWLNAAAGHLEAAEVSIGEVPGQLVLSSPNLTGEQLGTLMRNSVEDLVERDGIRAEGRTAVFDSKPGKLDLAKFKRAVATAAGEARIAADRFRKARVQGVGEVVSGSNVRSSYEISTTETNRSLVQAAIMAVLGDKLQVQRAINFATTLDEDITREHFFVVEQEDQFLVDVIGGEASFDIRRFRGGVAIEVVVDDVDLPITKEEFHKRLREVGLHPEFEHARMRESQIFPLGASTARPDGSLAYRKFAVLASDDSLRYEDDPFQWTEALAKSQLLQVEAALGMEKSLSSVIQFAPQVAGQARNRAVFAIVLALFAIVSYLWLRFGTKEYGFAAIVALIHDVGITLGLIAASHFVYGTVIGRTFLIEDFKIDLPMIAAILTVIGYSLNDTIVVFDRIRENRGRLGALSPNVVNNSINQTLSRTVLTSMTTFMVVFVLYAFGGKGVHGFSFALLIGVIVGTYSSIGIAAPLLFQPRLLKQVMGVIVTLALMGFVFAVTEDQTTRLVMLGVLAVGYLGLLIRSGRGRGYLPAGQPV